MTLKKISGVVPENVRFGDDIAVDWKDGTTTRFRFRRLRYYCPCAACVDELSGERTIRPEDVPEGITAKKIEYVGNYAIRIFWSDNHSTGIYTFKSLRKKHPARMEK